MTEKEFIEVARKRGLSEENIKAAIRNYYLIKEKAIPDLELDNMIIESAIRTQEVIDNRPDDMISVD